MLALTALVPRDPFNLVVLAVGVLGIFLLTIFAVGFQSKGEKSTFQAYLKFFWACFVKPHTGDGSGSQQDALVSDQSSIGRKEAHDWCRKASTKHRPMCTMLLGPGFSKAERTCWDLWRRN
jgi:hypothetical protein